MAKPTTHKPEFTDSTGTKWHPRVTYGVLRRIEEETGFSPMQQDNPDARVASTVFPRCLFEACRQEAVERGVNHEDFLQRIDEGPALEHRKAWTEALASFIGVQETQERPTADGDRSSTSGSLPGD